MPVSKIDLDRCIGCGSCAVNCPTQAITLEEKDGERRLRMCGAEMSRHTLLACASCGVPYIPPRHLDYIRRRTDAQVKTQYPLNICPACARKVRAEDAQGRMTI